MFLVHSLFLLHNKKLIVHANARKRVASLSARRDSPGSSKNLEAKTSEWKSVFWLQLLFWSRRKLVNYFFIQERKYTFISNQRQPFYDISNILCLIFAKGLDFVIFLGVDSKCSW